MQRKTTSRRTLLQTAAGLAAIPTTSSASPAPTLPTVQLGRHKITRLICGSNPFYGYAHFNRLYSLHMKEWMTPEHVLNTLRQCERNGINTWQLSYSERSISDLKRHRTEGGKMNIVILSGGKIQGNPAAVPEAAKLNPVGIVHHGGVTDRKFREGRESEVKDYLKAIRDSGVLVGLSTHNPAVIESVEERGWDIDFYMCCFYYVTRTREQIVKLLGEFPLGELFLEKDPERMTAVIRQTKKPCLGFKILAAGRKTDRAKQVSKAFNFAFASIKPSDAVIVGMYPRYQDQVSENAALVRRILG